MITAATLMTIGRVVFGAFFIVAGVRNFLHIADRKGSPTNYGFVLPMPINAFGFVMQLVGGLSLVLNFHVVAGAVLLIVFLVLATSLFHNLFLFKRPERDLHLYLTTVNITLAAGLLMIIAQAMSSAGFSGA